MKTMTCQQLGGACNKEFKGNTFEEIAEQSKKHGMEMYQQGDKLHIEAMEKMKDLMQTTEAMKQWFENKKSLFNVLPTD
jgi:predicted small metal-binding protein